MEDRVEWKPGTKQDFVGRCDSPSMLALHDCRETINLLATVCQKSCHP